MKFRISFIIVFALLQFPIHAQDEGLLQQLKEDDQKAIEAIALYPETERAIILEAASYPEILVRMQGIRERTEIRFRQLLEDLPEDEQQHLFNLSRYPELITQISTGKERKTKKVMEALVANYPEDICTLAMDAQRNHLSTLIQINKLYTASELTFNDVLSNYPTQVKEAYTELLKLPEVVNILTENIATTVLLGDLYKRQPVQLKKELDSLNVLLAEEKARELNDWKQSLEENPEAMAEYEQAAQEFASEQGYDNANYSEPVIEKSTTEVYVYNSWRPYPYWFGWPWWYSCECWYPYPWWYHWGYYYGPSNVVVFVGLPSTYFMYWHFNHYPHFYYYPHFTNHAVRYYSRYRNSNTSVTTTVRKWEAETKNDLSENWLDDESNRVERIREYGKLKMDYQSLAKNAGSNLPSQREYLRDNPEKYPALKPSPEVTPASEDPPQKKEQKYYPNKNYPTPTKQPRQKEIGKEPSKRQEIDRAKTYHENTWQRSKPQPRSTSPRTDQKRQIPMQKQPPASSRKKSIPGSSDAPKK